MNNCLVTKLKSSVQNENLKKLGEFVFSDFEHVLEFTKTNGVPMIVSPRKGTVYAVIGSFGSTLPSPLVEPLDVTNATTVSVKVEDGSEASIIKYYDITGINNGYIPVSIFNNLTQCTSVRFSNEGYVSDIDKAKLAGIDNVLDFGLINYDEPILPYLLLAVNAKKVYMELCPEELSMKDIGDNITITSDTFIGGTTLSGSLEDFVASQQLKGKSAANNNNITLYFNRGLISNVYYNDAKIKANYGLLIWDINNGNTTIKYKPTSSSAFTETTIHVNSDGTWTRIP